MITSTRTPLGEVWMQLTNRKLLKKLMAIQEVSARELAKNGAGWKSHSYMNRLLRGDVSTLDPEAAAGIALYLGVGIDDLFATRATNRVGQTAQRRSAA